MAAGTVVALAIGIGEIWLFPTDTELIRFHAAARQRVYNLGREFRSATRSPAQ